ncbi:hypothetical protein LTS18_015016, partial [Coniosporium uncinatum]
MNIIPPTIFDFPSTDPRLLTDAGLPPHSHLSTGAINGATTGVLIAVFLHCGTLYWLFRRHRRHRQTPNNTNPTTVLYAIPSPKALEIDSKATAELSAKSPSPDVPSTTEPHHVAEKDGYKQQQGRRQYSWQTDGRTELEGGWKPPEKGAVVDNGGGSGHGASVAANAPRGWASLRRLRF